MKTPQFNLNYAYDLQVYISKLLGENFNGWKFSTCDRMGTFMFEKETTIIYATPLWEGEESI